MKIQLEGHYKFVLFKEFTDDYGNPKDVGQELLESLMRIFSEPQAQEKLSSSDQQTICADHRRQESQEYYEPQLLQPQREEAVSQVYVYTNQEERWIQQLQVHNDSHAFRYANIDWLYWFEFQNKFSDVLQKYLQYLNLFNTNSMIKQSKGCEQFFVEKLYQFKTMMTSLFDMMNCEKCTNISYFALSDDIFEVFGALFGKKILGLEFVLVQVFDVFDALLTLSQTVQVNFKFSNPNTFDLNKKIIDPFLGNFMEFSRQLSKIKNSKIEKQIIAQKLDVYKLKDFIEVEGLSYDVQQSFVFAATLIQLNMNVGLTNKNHKTDHFEKCLPPQYSFEIFIEILMNKYLGRESKNAVLQVIYKLIQLDVIPRFRYDTAKKNPYFTEAIKYHQNYIEIFQRLTQYHTVDKVKAFKQKNNASLKIAPSPTELGLVHQDAQMDCDEQQRAEDSEAFDHEENCSEDKDFISSQSFFSDFINYLDSIAKVRMRQANLMIFPQIIGQIVQVITVPFIQELQMYPLNFSCQLIACKLLKNVLKTQQSFDDTQKLTLLIDKLKQEINLIKVQSQYQCPPEDDKAYHKLFDKSWTDPADDDFLSKYQNLAQRQLLAKHLLNLFCFCITRNDPNLTSYNQNFVSHSRKILESSIIQDDILVNIFKIHETLPVQQDNQIKKQIEQTISPLVLHGIQLVTHVFNDLPSKISTFISNGVFEGVLSSLTHGGIPASQDISFILASFMHMLTLNQDALQLLKDSKLIQQYFQLCLDPQKYHRMNRARLRGDYTTDQRIQSVVNSDIQLCEQLFGSILSVSKQIITKSHQLTVDYVAMDARLRDIDKQIHSIVADSVMLGEEETMLKEKEIEHLRQLKNELKQPYELQQQNFENFFCSYYLNVSQLLDQERGEQQNNIQAQIQANKLAIIEAIHQGVRNPVVASALHQHSNAYLTVVMYILNSTGPNELNKFAESVNLCLKKQLDNVSLLLNAQTSSSDQIMSTSLLDDGPISGASSNLSKMRDIIPEYRSNLVLFESFDRYFAKADESQEDPVSSYQNFMNGDNGLSSEDQMAIVLRKIYFYLEILIIYQKQYQTNYSKLKFLFELDTFKDSILKLVDLSTLITKNRGINYQKAIHADFQLLQKLRKKFQNQAELIEQFHYDAEKGFKPNQKPTTDLQKTRNLYYKFVHERGEISIVKDYDKLSETANVMNFECDDTICTNAQACQNQIKKLLKSILFNVGKRRVNGQFENSLLLPGQIYSLCYELAEKQILECLHFVQNGHKFLDEASSNEDLSFAEAPGSLDKNFDNIMFDVISGLFQTNKMMQSVHAPGAFSKGLVETILKTNFFSHLITFGSKITLFTEQKLKQGQRIPKFRLSYLKVMWKDIQILLTTLHYVQFLPNETDIAKFLPDFRSDMSDIYLGSLEYFELKPKQKSSIMLQYLNQARVNFKQLITKMQYRLCQALFNMDSGQVFPINQESKNFNIFSFMNKYCLKNCFNILVRIYDNLLHRFENMQVFKRMQVKKQSTAERELSRTINGLAHLGDFGRNSRFEILYNVGSAQVGELNAGPNRLALSHHAPENNQIPGGQSDAANAQAALDLEQRLMDMGFSRENVQSALMMANNDFDQSLDILVNEQQNVDYLRGLKEKNEAKGSQEGGEKVTEQKLSFDERLKMIQVKEPAATNTSEFTQLIFSAFEQLLCQNETSEEIYSEFIFDEDSKQVYGNIIRIDKIFETFSTFLKNYIEFNFADESSQNGDFIFRIEELFKQQQMSLFSDSLSVFESDALTNIRKLKNLVFSVFVYRNLQSKKVFDQEYFKNSSENMRPSNAIRIFIKILNEASKRLLQVYVKIKDMKQKLVKASCSRSDNELVNNQLPLLQALIQMIQEILWSYMFNDELDSSIMKVVSIASTVKDAPWLSASQRTEKQVHDKIQIIQQYYQKIRELFYAEDPSESSIVDSLEPLLISQINLLKVYNNTPIQIYNQNGETLYPVSIAVCLLTNCLRISDIFSNLDKEAKKQTQNDLRKKFLQNDGMKYLFGVKVVDLYCNDPDEFKKAKLSTFMKEQLQNGLLIENFVQTLSSNKQSMIQKYENQIKQLMFIQYKQNCKRESKKDISEWYKPVFEEINRQVHSPKANKKQGFGNQKNAPQSQKKGKGEKKSSDVQSANIISKNQSKQLKILMKKNEAYNEVPLKQFIEFFIQSQCSMPINDPEFFIAACNSCCVIDIVEQEQNDEKTNSIKAEKITTIKLKDSVLKELILESKNDPTERSGKQQPNLQSEFKKDVVDFQFQNEIIQQLLDMLIFQFKGYKMSILKSLKNPNRSNDDLCPSQKPSAPMPDLKIDVKNNKMILKTSATSQAVSACLQDSVPEAESEEPIEMNEYVFNCVQVLQVISNEIYSNPVLVGSVLKHRDQKTFKYIIRNIIALKGLKIVGKEKQIVFQEDADLDQKINTFFRRMLLNTHTISKSKKIYRLEAKKVFIKEITKNLVEYELNKSGEVQFNTKLLQNYCALLLISQFLMVSDKRFDQPHIDQRVKAIQQSIRRYNQAQKQQMLNQIILETQIMQNRSVATFEAPQGITINFFRHIYRIRDEIQSEDKNLIIRFKPKALTQCIDILLQIINQFSKKKDLWKQLVSDKKRQQGYVENADQKSKHNKDLKNKKSREGSEKVSLRTDAKQNTEPGSNQVKQSNMDNIVESESEEESQKNKKIAQQRGEHGSEGDDFEGEEDASLTLEDKKEIQQLREEDRRSNMESIGRRTRSNRGNAGQMLNSNVGFLEAEASEEGEDEDGELDMEEEEDENELEDFSENDSYDLQEIGSNLVGSFGDDEDLEDEDIEDEYYDDEDIEMEDDEEIGEDELDSEEIRRILPQGADDFYEDPIDGNGADESNQSETSSEESEHDNLSSYENEDDFEEDDDHDEELYGSGSYDEEALNDSGSSVDNHEEGESDDIGDREDNYGQENQNSQFDDEISSLDEAGGYREPLLRPRDINANSNSVIGLSPEVLLGQSSQANEPRENLDLAEFENQLMRSLGLHAVASHPQLRQRSRSGQSSNSGSQSLTVSNADNNHNRSRLSRPPDDLFHYLDALSNLLQKFGKGDDLGSKPNQQNQVLTRSSKRENEADICKQLITQLQSVVSNQSTSCKTITNKLKLFNSLYGCVQNLLGMLSKQIKRDQNLYLQNITIINPNAALIDTTARADQKSGERSSLVDYAGSDLLNTNEQFQDKLAQIDSTRTNDSMSQDHMNISKNAQDSSMIKLANLDGYFEFQRAMKIISGEEVPLPADANLQQLEQKQAEPSKQISKTSDNAFDKIDPLFTEALNAPSIQIIKEGDQLIKKIQQQSSVNIANQQQILTINDFLKKQNTQVRQQLLKNLDQNIITYLSSDLYAEAKRIRQQNNPLSAAQQLQPGGPLSGHVADGNIGAQNFLSSQNAPRARLNAAVHQGRRGNQAGDQQQNLQRSGGPQSGIAAGVAANPSQQPTHPSRNRFISMDSQTLNIETIQTKNYPFRDSESEDLNIPQQRSNFHINAFFFNIHTFMKENMENLKNQIVKDQLRQACFNAACETGGTKRKADLKNSLGKDGDGSLQIYTNEDLEFYCDKLILDQFKESKPESQDEAAPHHPAASQPQQQVPSSNVSQIIGLLDIAMTEIICSKANMQAKQLSPEKQLQKLKVVVQIPNFRLGLIVKIVQAMNSEMARLINHVKADQKQASNAQIVLLKKLSVYKGSTKIWDLQTAEEPQILSPRSMLNFFFKYIYELQQIALESKSSKLEILDLIKKPSSDKVLQQIYAELGLLDKMVFFSSSNQYPATELTILDQILQMIVDYIKLLSEYPDAFELLESQEKEFNRWKQEVLQSLCLILQQINISLNILKRKSLGGNAAQEVQSQYSLSNNTLNKVFQILFFIDQDESGLSKQSSQNPQKRHLFLDQTQKSTRMVSRVLTRVVMLPLHLESVTGFSTHKNTQQIGEEIIENQESECRNLLSFDASDKQKQELSQIQDTKESNNIVTMKLSQILNNLMHDFCSFFEEKFEKQNLRNTQSSILSCNSKLEKKKLALLIEKILHILKISLNLSFAKTNICKDEYLLKVLSIVQRIIDNEDRAFEQEQQQSLNNRGLQTDLEIHQIIVAQGDHSQGGNGLRQNTQIQQTYMFAEEFKLIMQLIFTLSEYHLKKSLKHYEDPKSESKLDVVGAELPNLNQPAPIANQPAQPLQLQLQGLRQTFSNRRGAGGAERPRERQATATGQQTGKDSVFIQKIEDMKSEFEDYVENKRVSSIPNGLSQDKASEEIHQIKELTSKYKEGRVSELIYFFFRNKKLINKFIHVNQSVINSEFQNLVIQVPEILDFDSKRLLWRVCIKKYLRKNIKEYQEYEIDIGVRRNQVFGDSFEQLKDIQVESWKQKFSIEFHDEEGVDEGGLTKEWFELISKGIFDPNYALFLQSSKGSTYYPNPNSVVHEKEEMIELFRFVGRIIGKALCEGQLLDCYFVRAIYKMMLGQTLELKDLEDFDEQLYKSLLYMLENDAEMLCQNFVLSSKFFDANKDIELKEDGQNIDVTNENKFEYCQLVLYQTLYKCVKAQIDAFLSGFHDLVPENLIKVFEAKELELLISGLPQVDIEDLKENVMYKTFTKQSNVIQWLWEVLEELNNSERAEFIQFVTGSSKVPVEGFRGLRTNQGIQKIEIIKLTCDSPDQRLPQAHTCFFQLDLPEYSTKEILRAKLLLAIKEGKTFNLA